MPRSIAIFALLALAAPAGAEVVTADTHGFEVRYQVPVAVPPAQLWSAIGEIANWWSADHTYSGKSANLSLELRPGGCFCERIPDKGGGVEHMRVAYVVPGERLVMTGGLGPLLYEGVSAVMDMRVDRAAGGSTLVMDYRAAGFARGNGEELAAAVDGVLGEQVKRLRAFAVAGGGKTR